MGKLVEGTWHDVWYDTKASGGAFVRHVSSFRKEITADGEHPPATDRYHLYVAKACPWAHRTLIYRKLKGLERVLTVSVVDPDMLERGWVFTDALPDHLYGSEALWQVYTRADPTYSGRVTVPVLWDKQRHTAVNNESSEIIRFLDTGFHAFADPTAPLADHELAPAELRPAIDAINAEVYDHVNNGVYKCGFATTQAAYDTAAEALFATLDALEARLEGQPWLVGDRLTEADLRLFPTLLRFDPVYHGHFKCSKRRVQDYPNLWDHTRAVYQIPGVRETVDMDAIRRHYYYSHETINPHRIVPVMPQMDLDRPADRTRHLPETCRP